MKYTISIFYVINPPSKLFISRQFEANSQRSSCWKLNFFSSHKVKVRIIKFHILKIPLNVKYQTITQTMNLVTLIYINLHFIPWFIIFLSSHKPRIIFITLFKNSLSLCSSNSGRLLNDVVLWVLEGKR